MSIVSINPVNGKLVKAYKEDSENQILSKIEKAQKTHIKWCESSYRERAALLIKTAAVLKERKMNWRL